MAWPEDDLVAAVTAAPTRDGARRKQRVRLDLALFLCASDGLRNFVLMQPPSSASLSMAILQPLCLLRAPGAAVAPIPLPSETLLAARKRALNFARHFSRRSGCLKGDGDTPHRGVPIFSPQPLSAASHAPLTRGSLKYFLVFLQETRKNRDFYFPTGIPNLRLLTGPARPTKHWTTATEAGSTSGPSRSSSTTAAPGSPSPSPPGTLTRTRSQSPSGTSRCSSSATAAQARRLPRSRPTRRA